MFIAFMEEKNIRPHRGRTKTYFTELYTYNPSGIKPHLNAINYPNVQSRFTNRIRRILMFIAFMGKKQYDPHRGRTKTYLTKLFTYNPSGIRPCLNVIEYF